MNYFIRHTNVLDISVKDFKGLFEKRIFGVHFGSNYANDEKELLDSNSEIYANNGGRSALTRLHKLANAGGYIWCDYSTIGKSFIGEVESNSTVFLEKLKPSRNENNYEKEYVFLKCLEIKKSRIVENNEFLSLKARRPQQGTFVTWPASGNSLERICENNYTLKSLEDLSVDQQEVMVYEYLRREGFEDTRIECLLMPIGRTLKDIDIYALGSNGKKIFVQVTNHDLDLNANVIKDKINRLRQFAADDVSLVFVCNGVDSTSATIFSGKKPEIQFINIQKIFCYMKKIKIGSFDFLDFMSW